MIYITLQQFPIEFIYCKNLRTKKKVDHDVIAALANQINDRVSLFSRILDSSYLWTRMWVCNVLLTRTYVDSVSAKSNDML